MTLPARLSSWTRLPIGFRPQSIVAYALPLLILLCLAWAVRQPMLRQMGYRWDTYTFEEWTTRVLRDGLFNVYSEAGEGQGMSVNHPPIGLALLSLGRSLWAGDPGTLPPDQHAVDLNPDYIQALKLPIIAIDLVLVIVGYTYAYAVVPRRRSLWAVATGAALAFNPALLINSAWWGQTDGLLALFLVFTVIALHFRRHNLMWFFYALALLIKFQAAPLFPLLLVLTWRRQGWKGVFQGGIISFMTVLVILIPITLNSGLAGALRPYLGTVGQYPFVTVKAHNFWFWGLSSSYDLTGAWHTMPFDSPVGTTEGVHIAGVSARFIGFALFGLCVLWISVQSWASEKQRRDEFLLATALHMSFFIFSTQMQARYLYPALVLLTFAWVTHRALIGIWAIMSITILFNILLLASHDAAIWQTLYEILVPIPEYLYALVNTAITMVILFLAKAPPIQEEPL